jgi:hypothetical protein
MAGADADEEEGPVWTAAVKETLNHNMLRPFFYQCEMCGGMGHCEGESTICRHCDGSGFVGPKGRFLPHDPHEPGAELIWVSGFTAPMHSVARKLSTGDDGLHENAELRRVPVSIGLPVGGEVFGGISRDSKAEREEGGRVEACG